MELEIDEILGLPAHPLIVHAVIALIPAAALLTVVAAVWPAARRRIGWLGVLLAVGAVVSVWAAQGSGEKLEDRIEETDLVEEHTEIGDQLLWPTLGLLVGSVLVTAVGRRDGRPAVVREPAAPVGATSTRGATAVGAVVAVIAIATSGVATVQVFRAGHSGAKAVWDDTGSGDDGDDSGRGRGRGRGGDEGDSLGIPGAQLPLR
jgi:hypothetical protein